MALPDFLVIGAQKAGTTWLHEHLSRHPQVWLPPVKELHYFDRSRNPLILDALRQRQQRAMLRRWLGPAAADALRHPSHAAWHARFFLSPRSDDWYKRCFSPGDGQICGEITPAYARLDDDGVERAARLLPQARIIYILRHPVERMWSQAAMYFSRYGHKGLARASEDEIDIFLNWDLAQANNRYDAAISRWLRHFPQSQFHVAFYDQLRESPHSFLSGICDFLGLETPPDTADLRPRIHAGNSAPMPAAVKARLAKDYAGEIAAIHARLDHTYTQRWHDSIERYQK